MQQVSMCLLYYRKERLGEGLLSHSQSTIIETETRPLLQKRHRDTIKTVDNGRGRDHVARHPKPLRVIAPPNLGPFFTQEACNTCQ